MSEPLVLTRDQSRRVDQIAIERYGIPGVVLMENAGRGVVDVLLGADPLPGLCAILCGKGNNAGDGFVIARHLEIRGVAAEVLLAFPPDQLTGDARINYEILTHCGVPIVELPRDGLIAALDEHAGRAAWLVDALLGTGATGEPREPLASIIAWMNRQGARRLAVDLPSGLDCDTGRAAAATVQADVTCTFVAAKPGLVSPDARQYVGEFRVVSIGVPPRLVREAVDAERH